MNVVREFGKYDFMQWGGAQPFGNNKAPYIYERELPVDNALVTVIGDANGISIYIFSDEDGDDSQTSYVWELKKSMCRGSVRTYMKHLAEKIQEFTYAPDLAYALDIIHGSDDVLAGFEYVGEY